MQDNFDATSATVRSGQFKYMQQSVTPSLHRNGKVLTRRDIDGSDAGSVGVDLETVNMPVQDARAFRGADRQTLSRNGFELVSRPIREMAVNFLDHHQVVAHYYPHCADVVRDITGATMVAAFDHNIRSATGKQSAKRIEGGQQVQGPAHVVHGDYTLTSAPERLKKLTQSPGANDTWRAATNHSPLLDSSRVANAIATGRFAIVNVWRNIAREPVARNPMALCDARTVRPEDLVVFEIHYADRVGENYFARPADTHKWYCFPAMTPDEALLITQWDSAGELARTNGMAADNESTNPDSPCTFSFHTAFEDPTTPVDAPDRWSIEVRCAVLYD